MSPASALQGKQQLTATRLHELLMAEGHRVGVTLVKEAVAGWKRQRREVFAPLPASLAWREFARVIMVRRDRRDVWWATRRDAVTRIERGAWTSRKSGDRSAAAAGDARDGSGLVGPRAAPIIPPAPFVSIRCRFAFRIRSFRESVTHSP